MVTALGHSPTLGIVRHRRSLAPPAREGRTTVVGADLLERDGVAAVARFNPDVVVHLAWDGLSDFRSDLHLEQVATHMRMLEAFVDAGVKRIVDEAPINSARGPVDGQRSRGTAARKRTLLSAGDCNTGLVGCLLMVRELEGVDAGSTSVVGGA